MFNKVHPDEVSDSYMLYRILKGASRIAIDNQGEFAANEIGEKAENDQTSPV